MTRCLLAGLLLIIFIQLLRCCGCCGQTPPVTKTGHPYNAGAPTTSRPPQISQSYHPQGGHQSSLYNYPGAYQSSHLNYPVAGAGYR